MCGSIRVSASGYCFAHDPEVAEWRERGVRASSRKRQAARRLKEAGVGHLVKMMEERFEGSSLGGIERVRIAGHVAGYGHDLEDDEVGGG